MTKKLVGGQVLSLRSRAEDRDDCVAAPINKKLKSKKTARDTDQDPIPQAPGSRDADRQENQLTRLTDDRTGTAGEASSGAQTFAPPCTTGANESAIADVPSCADGLAHAPSIGAASGQAEAAALIETDATAQTEERSAPRADTKLGLLVVLLSRAEGATLAELTSATRWLPHTTRAAMTRLRQRGFAVERFKQEAGGVSFFRIAGSHGVSQGAGQ